MNEPGFRGFLKRGRRKDSAIEQIVGYVIEFERYLEAFYADRALKDADPETLESYVSWLESETSESASKPLWALRYFFDFIEREDLSDLAGELRAERIKRKSFQIGRFRGVNPEYIAKLGTVYIENVDQMLDAGRTPRLRRVLSEQTGIPPEGVLELVKLADLSRLGAVRGVRARLYHDAGLTPKDIASWDPDELRLMLVKWVEDHQFDGIAPQPKEVRNLVADARRLPEIVIY